MERIAALRGIAHRRQHRLLASELDVAHGQRPESDGPRPCERAASANASTPSIPDGGTALTSSATRKFRAPASCSFARICTPPCLREDNIGPGRDLAVLAVAAAVGRVERHPEACFELIGTRLDALQPIVTDERHDGPELRCHQPGDPADRPRRPEHRHLLAVERFPAFLQVSLDHRHHPGRCGKGTRRVRHHRNLEMRRDHGTLRRFEHVERQERVAPAQEHRRMPTILRRAAEHRILHEPHDLLEAHARVRGDEVEPPHRPPLLTSNGLTFSSGVTKCRILRFAAIRSSYASGPMHPGKSCPSGRTFVERPRLTARPLVKTTLPIPFVAAWQPQLFVGRAVLTPELF